MAGKPAWGEVAIGTCTVLFAAVVGWQTLEIPSGAIYAQVGPKVIPWLVTGLLGVLGAMLAVQGLLGGNIEQGDDNEFGAIDFAGGGWLLLGLALNVALIDRIGFILASTALFVCTARAFHSNRPVRDAVIGFAVAFVAYVGFDRVLGYKIGAGLIESLI
ncbi:MAG TPA: tripartite tricarboxylate transporter TctB family protein [Hyphomicrobiaceae bacterium]|nr:tripartite tricarboxylate transporter TctB family protein [Hyphomicrobiaceae bacterium]